VRHASKHFDFRHFVFLFAHFLNQINKQMGTRYFLRTEPAADILDAVKKGFSDLKQYNGHPQGMYGGESFVFVLVTQICLPPTRSSSPYTCTSQSGAQTHRPL
jgi:hypothetical protein